MASTDVFIKISYIFLLSCIFRVYSLTHQEINTMLLGTSYDFKDIMRRQMGGRFQTGFNDPKSRVEYPVYETEVKPFYMDVYPVTNAQFWRYKLKKPRFRTDAEESGYSMVPSYQVSKIVKRKWATETEGKPWWLKVTGAQWDRPAGAGTSVRFKLDYPVVHVSYYDARAYCQFIGKRLPTEDEWEFAARAELKGKRYPWGDKFQNSRMNLWQGKFPDEDKGVDGYKGLSPVDAFPAQNNASMHDMLGNVWEWTTTKFYEQGKDRLKQPERYVLKGGSFLDTHDGLANHIVRTSNKMGQEPTYTAYNVGFRCAASAPQLVKQMMREQEAKAKATATKTVPHIHKHEDMNFQPPRRMKQPRGKRAQMREFIARTQKDDTKRKEKHSHGMRKEEL